MMRTVIEGDSEGFSCIRIVIEGDSDGFSMMRTVIDGDSEGFSSGKGDCDALFITIGLLEDLSITIGDCDGLSTTAGVTEPHPIIRGSVYLSQNLSVSKYPSGHPRPGAYFKHVPSASTSTHTSTCILPILSIHTGNVAVCI